MILRQLPGAALSLALVAAAGQAAAQPADAPSNWMRDYVTSRVAAQNLRAISSETRSVPSAELMSLVRPRIVGGTAATADQNPFQVGLLMASQPNNANAQFCGGTLVRPNFVVTAAHCSDFVTAGQVQVLTGARRLDGTRRPAQRGGDHHPPVLEQRAPSTTTSRSGSSRPRRPAPRSRRSRPRTARSAPTCSSPAGGR